MFKRKKKEGSLKSFAPTPMPANTSTTAASHGVNGNVNGNGNTSGTPTIGKSSLHDAGIDMGVTATSAGASNDNTDNGTPVSFLESLHDTDVIERVRTTIKHSHVFKLPTRQSGSIGWRGADWKEKVWHGTVKVVDRDNLTAVLLVDASKNTIFAVCPIKEGVNAVERCVDSSRYFVLRIENQLGRHMFIGLAFNERNDAFDFNTAMQDAKKERDFELNGQSQLENEMNAFSMADYSLKKGETIKVNIPKKYGDTGAFDTSSNGRSSHPQGQPQGQGTLAFANFQAASFDSKDDSPEKVFTEEDHDTPIPVPVSSSKKNINKARERAGSATGGFQLKPSKKDTPARTHS